MMDDDHYDKHQGWTYRVFSERYDEPDVLESGRRYLTFRRVWWTGFPADRPIPGDSLFY
jgi:hypothetical protein